MSVTLLVISPLASVRGPDCNEKQSSQQGNPLPPPVRGGLKPAVGHRADGGGRARRSPESSLSGKIYKPGRDVSTNPDYNPILTQQRTVPEVRLGYASTGQSKIIRGGKIVVSHEWPFGWLLAYDISVS